MKEEQVARSEKKILALWEEIAHGLQQIEETWLKLSPLLREQKAIELLPIAVQKLFARGFPTNKDIYWLMEQLLNQYERSMKNLRLPIMSNVITQLNKTTGGKKDNGSS